MDVATSVNALEGLVAPYPPTANEENLPLGLGAY